MCSFFGGGGYEAPEMPETTVMPSSEEKEPVSRAVREEERRRIRARRGMSGTLLTSPLGTTGGGNGLLGRV